MPRIHVCALNHIDATAQAIGARSMVTLINPDYPVERPAVIAAHRHHRVDISDITEPLEGHVAPGAHHVERFLEFVQDWDRREPMLIHCYAGVSRSTAAAFIAVCALAPERNENETARLLRRLSPTATPNLLLVRHADLLLRRDQRMVEAIKAIGRGEECAEGVPFAFEIG
jgi:predicted protein tyrosine phosphatase